MLKPPSMPFDIIAFIRANRKIFIWGLFFALIYLVKSYGLFGLVFITYILCFIFSNVVNALTARFGMPRRLWTAAVYILFLAALFMILSIVLPKLGTESAIFIKKLPETMSKIQVYLDKAALANPDMDQPIQRLKKFLSLESMVGVDVEALFGMVMGWLNQITNYVSYFLLGTLFSFLILFDLPRLSEQTKALRNSRMRGFYDETAESVVRFGQVVGTAFQAQMAIAALNTALTCLGLLILGISPIVLLGTVVFFCGLIPVLGTFISSTPIVLLAFNVGGFSLVGWAIVMILMVHTIETYILNPRIVSAMFKIRPLITLVILYIGHALFGLWGMLLGVPVSVFIFRYVIMEPRDLTDPARAGVDV